MSKSKNKRRGKAEPKAARPIIPPLAAVCSAPDDLLGKLDIAALNLMCAADLPGSENLNYGKLFDWLDDAAKRVDLETRRHWYRFTELSLLSLRAITFAAGATRP